MKLIQLAYFQGAAVIIFKTASNHYYSAAPQMSINQFNGLRSAFRLGINGQIITNVTNAPHYHVEYHLIIHHNGHRYRIKLLKT